MGVSDILSVVQTASLVLGICVAVGTIRGRNQGSAATLAEMRKDI